MTTKQKNEKKYLIEARRKVTTSIDSMIKLLTENKVDINVKNDKGNTALHLAIGNKEKVKVLLDRKAKLEIKNKMGDTALHLAAGRGSEEIVKLLLENGADANSMNKKKRTAFEEAELSKKTKVARYLKIFTYKKSGGDKIE